MLSALQISLVSGLMASVLASPFDLEKRGCGNNCARAVIASNFPARPTAADCSSFFGMTTTLPTVTVYTTATATASEATTIVDSITLTQTDLTTQTDVTFVTTVTTKPYNVINGRDVVPTIPAYASACANIAAYSEACGCIGVTPYTVTLPAPVTTAVVPTTVTETNTVLTTNTQLATITEVVPTTATQTVVETVTAGPPVCVVQLPNACKSIQGKTGLALIGQVAACGFAIAQIENQLTQQVKTAAATCLVGGASGTAKLACLRAAFNCPA